MISIIILILITIGVWTFLLTPKKNIDLATVNKSKEKKEYDIYVRNEDLVLKDPIRYLAGSPGETSRVLTKCYYSMFYKGAKKSNKNTLDFLKYRNTSYGTVTGRQLDGSFLSFITNKYYENISTIIFFICLHETYSEKNKLYEENEAENIYRIILEEHNKMCPFGQEEKNEFSLEKFQKIKNTYDLLRGLSDLDNNKKIEKTSNNKNYNESDENSNQVEKTKFKIAMIFYQFCFNEQTAKIFLVDNKMSEDITRGLMLSRIKPDEVNITEEIFKIFAKKNYNLDLGKGSYGFYTINNYRFFIDTQRIQIENTNSYFEILYNDFKEIKDENGDSLSVANEFILYIVDYRPKAIFVLVFDHLLEVYALRRVMENGSSFSLEFFDNNEGSATIDYLEDYVKKNIF